jgi:large subunit ribosomal protein L33
MAKSKGPRIMITLECTECRQNENKRSLGVSRYLTSKNRRNTSEKLELFSDGYNTAKGFFEKIITQ